MRAPLATAAALVLAAPALAQPTTQAPAPAPTVVDSLALSDSILASPDPVEGAKVSFSPKVYAPFGWSPSTGIGIGYGVEIQNLGFAGSSLLLTGVTSKHTGRYGAYAQTRTPYAPGVNAMLGGTFETTGRRYYYGVGPFSSADNQVALERQVYEAEARAGYSTAPQARQRVQAFGRYQFFKHRTAEEMDGGALGRLDAPSALQLNEALARDASAVTGGVEGIWDERNNLYTPRFGFVAQAGVSFTKALAGSDVSFLRTYASANYFLPIEWRTSTLHLRGVVSSIDGIANGDANGRVPFYLQPVFDTDYGLGLATHRYYANDFFLVSGEVQTPVFITGALNLEAIGGATLYNAYDNIFKEFNPVPSLGKNEVVVGRNRHPLQLALGGGARLSSELLPGFVLHGQVGFSPEGLSITTFSIVADLRAARPILRGN